jgi:hypothetical protein
MRWSSAPHLYKCVLCGLQRVFLPLGVGIGRWLHIVCSPAACVAIGTIRSSSVASSRLHSDRADLDSVWVI